MTCLHHLDFPQPRRLEQTFLQQNKHNLYQELLLPLRSTLQPKVTGLDLYHHHLLLQEIKLFHAQTMYPSQKLFKILQVKGAQKRRLVSGQCSHQRHRLISMLLAAVMLEAAMDVLFQWHPSGRPVLSVGYSVFCKV